MTQIQTLESGATLLLERITHVDSCAVGIWFNVGSRHESEAQYGICHYLEHMVFKGTQKRSSAEIASITDTIGGRFNAYTTKETTAYFAHVMSSNLIIAADILTDMVFNAKLDKSDLELERGVILEEISMYEDSPENLVDDKLFRKMYPNQALGHSILGDKTTLDNLTSKDLRKMRDDFYVPQNAIIAIVGNYKDSDVQKVIKMFDDLPVGQKPVKKKAEYLSAFVTLERPLEQNHWYLAMESLPSGHANRFAKHLMTGILGGGWSSRLYQSLRDTHGLCYSVYAHTSPFSDTGILGVYTATNSETEEKSIQTACEILTAMASQGPTQDELDRHREQIKSNVILGLESTNSRMNHAVRSFRAHGRVLSTEEIVASYDAVTCSQVRDLMAETLTSPSFSSVGKVQCADFYQNLVGKFINL